jgi:glycerophosphoryl diester phosphodiesterase
MGTPTIGGLQQVAPFVVAHRAGNRLADLEIAEQAGTRLVEADVRLDRGRLEIRHLKSAGPLPLLWDRWEVRSRLRPRLQLHELLEATGDSTELMLDLKGPRMRLAQRVVEAIEPYLGARAFTVCARRWALLEPFAGLPVRRVRSVGTRRQLERLLADQSVSRPEGVVVHAKLLDARIVADLRSIADVVLSWPVNTPERARELLSLGVHGLISDRVEAITPILAPAGSA